MSEEANKTVPLPQHLPINPGTVSQHQQIPTNPVTETQQEQLLIISGTESQQQLLSINPGTESESQQQQQLPTNPATESQQQQLPYPLPASGAGTVDPGHVWPHGSFHPNVMSHQMYYSTPFNGAPVKNTGDNSNGSHPPIPQDLMTNFWGPPGGQAWPMFNPYGVSHPVNATTPAPHYAINQQTMPDQQTGPSPLNIGSKAGPAWPTFNYYGGNVLHPHNPIEPSIKTPDASTKTKAHVAQPDLDATPKPSASGSKNYNTSSGSETVELDSDDGPPNKTSNSSPPPFCTAADFAKLDGPRRIMPTNPEDRDIRCSVCLENLPEAAFTCRHVFCLRCIYELKKRSRRCPKCDLAFRTWRPVIF